MSWLKKIAFFILVLSGIIGLFASLGQYYYENEVKQYVKSSLNDILAAPVDVNEINFSLLQKFPNASISLEEVLAWDAFPELKGEDTLFYARRIFFEFSIIDIIQKKYLIKGIDIEDADIRIKWNKKGEPNYVIWKEQNQEESESLELNFEKVKFKNCTLEIDHLKSAFISTYKVDNLSFSGNLKEKILHLKSEGKLPYFSHLTDDFYYISDKELKFETDFLLDINNKNISLSNAKVDWNNVNCNAEGWIDYGKDEYSFQFKGNDQQLDAIKGILPLSLTKQLKDYTISSFVNFILETGNMDSDEWKSKIDFDGRDGKITHNPSAVSAKNLNYSGSLSINKSNTSVKIDSFSGLFSGGVFEGNFSMVNFSHPKIKAKLVGVFELSDLIPFIKNDAITKAVGSLKMDMFFNGSFYDLKNIQKSEIERAVTKGSIELNQIGFNLDKLDLELRELTGNFNFDDNDAEIPQLTGVWKGSNMQLQGSIKNFTPFLLLENQKLKIKAEGVFDRIDLEEFLTTSEEKQNKKSFEIPSYLQMEIDAKIGEVVYKKFIASEVYGHFIIQNSSLHSDDFRFNTAGGKLKSYLNLTSNSKGDLALKIDGLLSDMEVNKLFYEFENMGQNQITDKNIYGQLNAEVMFEGIWDKNLDLDLSSIKVLANIRLDNGELKDLTSLQQIGDYLKSNPLASAFVDTEGLSEKLKDIHFDNIQNQIEIREQTIYIPEMQLLSDAVDINLSGEHAFNNRIDYSLNFRLREIMKQRKETEFGIIEDDGLGSRIFIKMGGTTTNPIFSLDKTAKKDWKKESWKDEKKNINAILKEEFSGMFGGDNGEKPKEKAKKYEIEWDEDPDTTELGNKMKADSLEGDEKGKTLIFQTDEDIRDSDDDDY